VADGPEVGGGGAARGARLVVQWLSDASSRTSLAARDGRRLRDIPPPAIGSVAGLTGEWDGDEAFFGFSSFAVPPAVYRLDLATGDAALWQRVPAEVDPEAYRVRLVHYPSRD